MVQDEIDLESLPLKAFGAFMLLVLSAIALGCFQLLLYLFDTSMSFSTRDIPPLLIALFWGISNTPISLKNLW